MRSTPAKINKVFCVPTSFAYVNRATIGRVVYRVAKLQTV